MARDRVQLLGTAIIATGVIHLGFGTIFYGPPLRAMLSDGLVNSLGGGADRDATLWYYVAGGFLISAGATVRWARRVSGRSPAPLAWGLAAVGAVGAAVAPTSGFWLVLAEGIGLLVADRSAAEEPGRV